MKLKYTKVYLGILAVFILVGLMAIANAVQSLSPVKQGACIDLPQTCQTCTYNNLSVVQLQSNGTYLLRGEYAMTRNGMSYNYTFCNTTTLGKYFVDGHGDVNGVDTGWGGYTFLVNGSGQDVTQEQVYLIIIGIVVLLIVIIFFFVLGHLFKHPGTKVFFMAMSTITLIVLIGLTASQFSVYLAEFAGISSFYDKFYILTITLSGAAMAGLIVWLIYYSFKLFNKVRGRTPDED